MHWPYPPDPVEYQSPGLGLLVAMFAIVFVFLAVVFRAARSSTPPLHELEKKADGTGPEEKEPNKMAE